MALAIQDLAQAREVLAGLLEDLGIDASLFEVEPQEGHWKLTIECATRDGGWETINMSIDKDHLMRGDDDAVVHEFLVDELRDRLSECKLKAG
jgi:hypothetical protein